MTVSKFLEEQFTTDWAGIDDLSEVWVVATQNELTAFSRPTAIVSQQSIGSLPEAPLSHRTVGVTVEIVSHLKDRDAAAAELESIVPAVLDYLDPMYQHGTAVAFLYGDQFAYRIPVSVIAQKES